MSFFLFTSKKIRVRISENPKTTGARGSEEKIMKKTLFALLFVLVAALGTVASATSGASCCGGSCCGEPTCCAK